jgi:HAD superfamily hydrolase (TIGR01490 family)
MKNTDQGANFTPDIAVFDFDGTLTTKDSFFRFLAWRRPRMQLTADLFATSPSLFMYAARLVSNETHKMAMFARRFRGMNLDDFDSLSHDFSLDQIPRILRAPAVDRLLYHKCLGHRVVIVSASVGYWIEPWAGKLGVDDVIASRIEVLENRLTGRLDGPNCYGTEKLRRFLARYPDRASYRLHAYGDSRGDEALLVASDHRYYRCFS